MRGFLMRGLMVRMEALKEVISWFQNPDHIGGGPFFWMPLKHIEY